MASLMGGATRILKGSRRTGGCTSLCRAALSTFRGRCCARAKHVMDRARAKTVLSLCFSLTERGSEGHVLGALLAGVRGRGGRLSAKFIKAPCVYRTLSRGKTRRVTTALFVGRSCPS